MTSTILEDLRRVLEGLKRLDPATAAPELNDHMTELLEAWEQFKARSSRRRELVHKFQEILANTSDEAFDALRYFDIPLQRSDLELEPASLDDDELERAVNCLTELSDLATRASKLLREKGKSLREDQRRLEALAEYGPQIQAQVESLLSLKDSTERRDAPEGPQEKHAPTEPAQEAPPVPKATQEDSPEPPTEDIPQKEPVRSKPARKAPTKKRPDKVVPKQDAPPDPMVQAAWSWLGKGEFGKAYWAARSILEGCDVGREAGGVVPPWLCLSALLSLHGDWYKAGSSDRVRAIISEYPNPMSERPTGVDAGDWARMVAATAFRPTLTLPEAGALQWLQDVSGAILKTDGPMRDMYQAVYDLGTKGIHLDLRVLTDSERTGDAEKHLKRCIEELEAWQREQQSARTIYSGATSVLKYLSGPSSEIGSLVKDIINSKSPSQELIDRVHECISRQLLSRKKIDETIHQAMSHTARRGQRSPRIVGTALEQVIRPLERLRDLLEEWASTASVILLGTRDGDWRVEQVKSFRDRFLEAWSRAQELRDRGPDDENPVARAIRKASHLLVGTIAADLEGRGKTQSRHEPGWLYAVRKPLLLVPNPPLDDEGKALIDERFATREPVLEYFDEYDFRAAFRRHLDNQDFLAAECTLEVLETEGYPGTGDLRQDYDREYRQARENLEWYVGRVRNQIEQGTIDHVLTDGERTEFVAQLEAIANNSSRRTGQLKARLDEINQRIEELRVVRRQSLERRIDELVEDVSDDESDLSKAVLKNIEEARKALENNDLPVADEYLTYAEDILASGEIMPQGDQDSQHEAHLEDFLTVLDTLSSALEEGSKKVLNKLSKGKSVAGINMKPVRGAQHDEIRKGLGAFLSLKGSSRPTGKLAERYLTDLLEYMGFISPSVTTVEVDSNSAHYKAKMQGPSPLPEFGSLRNGHYDIVMIYGRPSIKTLAQTLEKHGVTGNCPIILYMGRLTRRQREEWGSHCKDVGLTALMVDEVILFFAASQRENRLPAIVTCGISWGYSNPYKSFGMIPPEMFKGRARMKSRLVDPKGETVIYGGRQLGKSVLLRMTQRQFHDPSQNRYVIYEDIKSIGDPSTVESDPSLVWERIRDALVAQKLLRPSVSSQRETLQRAITKLFRQTPDLRVIMLLDEADKFLEADSNRGFEDLTGLRRVMDDTDLRFKVVLSGLHNVQRYSRVANHPFAQYGEPLVIGPLEPAAARALVMDPLRSLGFKFERAEGLDPVLRILCYTNYLPALIQEFCSELVDLVRERTDTPPYVVTMEDVEAVYRRERFRQFMRERFEWTVDLLDNRHAVIVYAMVVAQVSDRDGYRKEFSLSEVQEIAEALWTEGFSGTGTEEVKALLEDLIGLGVLIKKPSSGTYRLRNGNVVRVLGSEQEIWERLEQIESKQAPMSFNPASCRLLMEKTYPSSLTVEQVGLLTRARSGVCLVFGSEALGLSQVKKTLEMYTSRRTPRADTAVRLQDLPVERMSTESIRNYLSSLRKRGPTIVIVPADRLFTINEDLSEIIGNIAAQLARFRRRDRWVRVVVLFNGPDTVRWLRLPEKSRNQAEGASDAIVTLKRCNEEGLRDYLGSMEVVNTPPAVKAVMKHTGGWPWLLRIFGGLAKRPHDRGRLRSARELAEDALGLVATDPKRRETFISATDVNNIPHGELITLAVRKHEKVGQSEMLVALETLTPEETYDGAEVDAATEALRRLGILDLRDGALVVEPVLAEMMFGK